MSPLVKLSFEQLHFGICCVIGFSRNSLSSLLRLSFTWCSISLKWKENFQIICYLIRTLKGYHFISHFSHVKPSLYFQVEEDFACSYTSCCNSTIFSRNVFKHDWTPSKGLFLKEKKSYIIVFALFFIDGTGMIWLSFKWNYLAKIPQIIGKFVWF